MVAHYVFHVILLGLVAWVSLANYGGAPRQLFYRAVDGEVYGPFPEGQIIQWCEAGYFPDDLPVSTSISSPFTPLRNLLHAQMVVQPQMSGFQSSPVDNHRPAKSYSSSLTTSSNKIFKMIEWGNVKKNAAKLVPTKLKGMVRRSKYNDAELDALWGKKKKSKTSSPIPARISSPTELHAGHSPRTEMPERGELDEAATAAGWGSSPSMPESPEAQLVADADVRKDRSYQSGFNGGHGADGDDDDDDDDVQLDTTDPAVHPDPLSKPTLPQPQSPSHATPSKPNTSNGSKTAIPSSRDQQDAADLALLKRDSSSRTNGLSSPLGFNSGTTQNRSPLAQYPPQQYSVRSLPNAHDAYRAWEVIDEERGQRTSVWSTLKSIVNPGSHITGVIDAIGSVLQTLLLVVEMVAWSYLVLQLIAPNTVIASDDFAVQAVDTLQRGLEYVQSLQWTDELHYRLTSLGNHLRALSATSLRSFLIRWFSDYERTSVSIVYLSSFLAGWMQSGNGSASSKHLAVLGVLLSWLQQRYQLLPVVVLSSTSAEALLSSALPLLHVLWNAMMLQWFANGLGGLFFRKSWGNYPEDR